MQDKKIDGKKISREIGEKLFLEIQENNLVGKISLGILCIGEDAVSMSYKNGKEKFGEKFGFKVNTVRFTDIENSERIKEELILLQEKNDAVILQLPLPDKFKEDTFEILKVLQNAKDVDLSNPVNNKFMAPVVMAFVEAMKIVEVDISKMKVAVVGLGQVVGMPIADYCRNIGAEVIEVGIGEHEKIKEADIVVSGVGKPEVIKAEFIKEGSVLVDYGYSYVDGKCTGDFENTCYSKCKFYTPVPGCMGPLDVACLFENVLKSVEK